MSLLFDRYPTLYHNGYRCQVTDNVEKNAMNQASNPNARTNDPQITLEGRLKQGERSDVITFRMDFYLLSLVFIVTIPEQGSFIAPVYVKFVLPRRS